jgi:hypothetical protein
VTPHVPAHPAGWIPPGQSSLSRPETGERPPGSAATSPCGPSACTPPGSRGGPAADDEAGRSRRIALPSAIFGVGTALPSAPDDRGGSPVCGVLPPERSNVNGRGTCSLLGTSKRAENGTSGAGWTGDEQRPTTDRDDGAAPRVRERRRGRFGPWPEPARVPDGRDPVRLPSTPADAPRAVEAPEPSPRSPERVHAQPPPPAPNAFRPTGGTFAPAPLHPWPAPGARALSPGARARDHA